MANRNFTYLLEEIPNAVDTMRLQAYLENAGYLGWELVSVTPFHDRVREQAHRYIFKLELGVGSKGTRPDKTW